MKFSNGNYHRTTLNLCTLLVLAFWLLLCPSLLVTVSAKINAPRKTCKNVIMPRFGKGGVERVIAGKTYEEWANTHLIWEYGSNVSASPAIDTTGEFSNQDQIYNVYLLADDLTETDGIDRHITIPKGKPAFIPISYSGIHYSGNGTETMLYELSAPRQADAIEALAAAGVNITNNISLAIVTSLYNKALCENLVFNMTLQVDGCKLDPFQQGLVWTQTSHVFTLKANDDLGLSQSIAAGTCGYFGMLAPFMTISNHTIYFAGHFQPNNNSLFWEHFGAFEFFSAVTYHVTVE